MGIVDRRAHSGTAFWTLLLLLLTTPFDLGLKGYFCLQEDEGLMEIPNLSRLIIHPFSFLPIISAKNVTVQRWPLVGMALSEAFSFRTTLSSKGE